ncbi:MAG: hypothetical protein BWK78_08630 [Thiotrichaceae bacterium IS1]|nr:MAG: hypothetical protein BWK78_08630 [Thiotrichaceae bacterium IS1]
MSILFTTWSRRILNLVAVLMGLCALVWLGGAIFKWQFVLDLPVVGTHPFLWALVFALGTLSIKFILRANQMRGKHDDSMKGPSASQSPPKRQEASSELAASEGTEDLLATSVLLDAAGAVAEELTLAEEELTLDGDEGCCVAEEGDEFSSLPPLDNDLDLGEACPNFEGESLSLLDDDDDLDLSDTSCPNFETASQSLPQKSQLLPHNGLFIRRNNSFGTQLTTSMKELIAQGVMIKQEQIRFDDFVAINTEGVPSPKPNNALAVSHGIAAIPAHQQHDDRATHYLEIALKTANTAPGEPLETQAPPVNYIFVVDVSGSMAGEKIDTVKASIRELFTHLQETDVIGVIAFDDRVETILESTPKQQLSADQFGKIINRLIVRGGTDLNLALSISIDEMRRYQGTQRVNQLFLFSDGNPNSGESNWINIRQNVAAKLRQSATSGGNIRLSTFIFGTDANKVEMDKLSGMTGGQSIFVIDPEKDVIHSLQQELARRSHLAAINVQMQIEIDPNIEILHFYGHDLITDPTTRAAVEREASLTRDKVKTDYGVESLPDLIKEDKGIRVFVPNLAVGEIYWVVFELAVPEPHQSAAFGKATVQYFDTVARQNQKPQFDLSPTGQIEPQWVVQHALGLWTSEVASYTLNDVEAQDLKTAEKRIQAHLSVLDTAKSDLTFQHVAKLTDDIITLNKLLSLAKNLNQAPHAGQARMYLNYGLGELDKVRNGFVQNVEYGE